jgi:hypothetical protein
LPGVLRLPERRCDASTYNVLNQAPKTVAAGAEERNDEAAEANYDVLNANPVKCTLPIPAVGSCALIDSPFQAVS